jgi:DNA-binding CsgD family transcriptional regulator
VQDPLAGAFAAPRALGIALRMAGLADGGERGLELLGNTGVEALTPSELRVARLAREGKTNREIAYALYVTPKTVEGHLARAYAKLEIRGRGELSQVLEAEKTRVPSLCEAPAR